MLALISAPTNLGLRPPEPGAVPGADKAPEALREAGLYRKMLGAGARDAGVVLPGRYRPGVDSVSQRIRNHDAIVDHARRLADRIGSVMDAGDRPLVLGGDCSILLGAGIALQRRGMFGLVHLDGHTDFRHPGNSDSCGSLAGEDLAAAVGLHWPALSDVDGLGAAFAASNVAHLGARDDDEHLAEATAMLGEVLPASELRRVGAVAACERVREVVDRAPHGFWLHLDIDVLDPTYFPAVDSPDAGGLTPEELIALLCEFAPAAIGAQIAVFDPDLDPDGRYARLLRDIVVAGLGELGSRVGNAATK